MQPINCLSPVLPHFCPNCGVRYDTKGEHVIWRPHPSIPLYKQPSVRYSQLWQTQALFTSCPASVSWKVTPWHVLLKDVIKFLPVYSTILDQIGWNLVQTSILYWRAYMKFYLHLLHFYQMWLGFSTGHVNENWCFANINPLNAILHVVTNNFCPYFPHLLPNVRKNQYKLPEYNAIQHLLSYKLAHGRLHISYGQKWNEICVPWNGMIFWN